ncbi:DsbA family protein [Dietzia sp. PP-33]|uniref:DsbA family protein n=1 Tax=Dietzia sp. PP-33 TaxID=2957500 RepID=UPI0029B8CC11|nr:thioredoxin domain-containing protein [Dietzia sp. PP-33]MDX2356400.1 DsbA family protein [Dietzia sp. PP-33]
MSRRPSLPVIALSVVVTLLIVLVAILLARGVTGGDQPAAGSATGSAAVSDERQTSPEQAPGPESMEGIARFEEGDPMAMGPVDAPVVMIMYSDFRCPFCAKFSREVEPALIEKYVDGGDLRIEWVDLPIFGKESMMAARAGRAAADQGRFWEFTEVVFADAPDRGHPDLGEEELVGYAAEAGIVDLDRFRADMTSDKYDEAIRADYQAATALGATSTPTFLINGTGIVGARSVETFRTVIDNSLDG